MSHDEYSLFGSAINFSEQRDRRSLENILIATLSDFFDFDSLILLRVPRNPDNKYLEVAASIPNTAFQDKLKPLPYEYGDPRVQRNDAINTCISSGNPLSEEADGKQRTLFPIVVNNSIKEILDLYGDHHSPETRKFINGFIRIYSNFLSIIDDNERDTLTGLLNRKTFDTKLTELMSSSSAEQHTLIPTGKERRAKKTDSHYWVGILDIDNFKAINDQFGHIYGDEVLLLFANLMGKTFRSNDLLFRYGGEEFVVVLEPTTESNAFMIFERFRQQLEKYDFPRVGRITVSAGFIKIDDNQHQSTLLEHADQALYYAKEHGRNQVCNYHALVKSGALTPRQFESNIELF
ncbi:MAG: GGDEF domain-containing protein [Porticoccaceae bacterium]|nr:GGDEF domain-containing protein [Porticoccaceae bacterium]